MPSRAYQIKELADYAEVEFLGAVNIKINGAGSLKNAREGQITFLAKSEYLYLLDNTQASAIIINEKDRVGCCLPMLISQNPYVTFVRICTLFPVAPLPPSGIHQSAIIGNNCTLIDISIAAGAVIGDHVVIGRHSIIGANCTIETGCVLGEYCHVMANAVLSYGTQLGKHVIIHPGAIIGSDGFGLIKDDNQKMWIKIPQRGHAVLNDYVEIGANSTIDRGTLDNTVLENGVKIDNQVHIGHNVCIGEHTAIAGQVGIAGSTTIGKRCQIGGHVGISGHLTIADDVTIAGSSKVSQSLTRSGFNAPNNPIFINNRLTRLINIVKKN